MFKGITKRWLINVFGVILAVVVILVICLSLAVKSFYYGTVDQALSGRSNELVNVFSNYTTGTSSDFSAAAISYVEDFSDKELMELMVINSAGRVIITSTGFAPDENEPMEDYHTAVSSPNGYGRWTGKLLSGEDVMAVTRTISNNQGTHLGCVRYVVSLEPAKSRIMLTNILLIIVGLLIVVFVAISGMYFVRSIVNPVRELSDTAKLISQGDFKAKMEKLNDDEIGDLCDSINDMATALDASEQMKNDFISRVSHELRTPLTAIKGWAETMQFGMPDSETFEKGMNVIAKESTRLTGIVEELLDFSKIQSGRMILQTERIDILAELDEAIYMLKERAVSEGKHLLYDEPDILPPVLGDRNRLKQVFINILDNALKYTQADGMIGVQAYFDKNTDTIKIVVADNGFGISSDDLPKVKDKFYKANQQIGGSGIGLAVADEIVNMHNGSLELESGLGVGTTVTISFPVYHEEKADEVNLID